MRLAQRLRLRLILAAAVAVWAGAAAPQQDASLSTRLAANMTLPPAVTDIALLGGWRREDGAHVAAIAIRLAPGWHTYWRSPGPTGIPPQFDWSASTNLATVAYEWPRPIVFDSFGSPTIGFKGALILPVILTPARLGAPVEARVGVLFGVCSDICIPAEAQLSARLVNPGAPDDRAEIEAALAARPVSRQAAGVTDARCGLAPSGDGLALTAEITFASPPDGDVTTVIEADGRPDLWIGPAETRTSGRTLRATARLDPTGAGGVAVDRGALRLTLLSPRRAVDIRGCPAP